ncbi:MAG: VWA domain-containing protein [Gammaproteobacteria bacterium]|nr:VWA domain-containing protein [Gammaproteobacteria bacterium]
MISLLWPGWLLALPLPWLVRRLLPASRVRTRRGLWWPFYATARHWAGSRHRRGWRPRQLLSLLAWCALVLAACRPVWIGEPVALAISGRDLLLGVDLSGSMEIPDMQGGALRNSRLQTVKQLAGEFIERRVGDRLGLILFGSRAYLQTPLTFDRKTVRHLLEEAEIGLAGDKTAIGDALGLAVKRLHQRPERARVFILLTDGANTSGEIAPLTAARLAADQGVRVHVIGVGAEHSLERRWAGMRSIDPSSALDEPTLQGIAELTGGEYFRARNEDELEGIYALLDRIEPVPQGDTYLRPRLELYLWPLATALLLAALPWLAAPLAARRERAGGPGAAPGLTDQMTPRKTSRKTARKTARKTPRMAAKLTSTGAAGPQP